MDVGLYCCDIQISTSHIDFTWILSENIETYVYLYSICKFFDLFLSFLFSGISFFLVILSSIHVVSDCFDDQETFLIISKYLKIFVIVLCSFFLLVISIVLPLVLKGSRWRSVDYQNGSRWNESSRLL